MTIELIERIELATTLPDGTLVQATFPPPAEEPVFVVARLGGEMLRLTAGEWVEVTSAVEAMVRRVRVMRAPMRLVKGGGEPAESTT